MWRLTAMLRQQQAEAVRLDAAIAANLKEFEECMAALIDYRGTQCPDVRACGKQLPRARYQHSWLGT